MITSRNDTWKFAKEVYVDEISVAAQWASMNPMCKASLGQQSAFAYTDYQNVRCRRHFAPTRNTKENHRILKGTPAKYHTLISHAGFDNGQRVPNFIVPLIRDEMINDRVSSMAQILTIGQTGGYSGENVCHPHSWSTQIFAKHVRGLGLYNASTTQIILWTSLVMEFLGYRWSWLAML